MTIKQEIQKEVSELSLKGLAEQWEELSKKKKMLALYEDALKTKMKTALGTKSQLALDGDFGVKWQDRNFWEVPMTKAESIVQDKDQLNQIVKVDLKRAKEILDEETYQQLEKSKESIKTVKALVVGKLK